jgi:hypothetical protein
MDSLENKFTIFPSRQGDMDERLIKARSNGIRKR